LNCEHDRLSFLGVDKNRGGAHPASSAVTRSTFGTRARHAAFAGTNRSFCVAVLSKLSDEFPPHLATELSPEDDHQRGEHGKRSADGQNP